MGWPGEGEEMSEAAKEFVSMMLVLTLAVVIGFFVGQEETTRDFEEAQCVSLDR